MNKSVEDAWAGYNRMELECFCAGNKSGEVVQICGTSRHKDTIDCSIARVRFMVNFENC